MRKWLLTILCLGLMHGLARGQTLSYRYWFDTEQAVTQTGTLSAGQVHLDLPIDELAAGEMHILHLQVVQHTGTGGGSLITDNETRYGTTVNRFFMKLPPVADKLQCNFLVDGQTVQSDMLPVGAVAQTWSVDCSTLEEGIHQYLVQVLAADGRHAAVKTGYFLKTQDFGHMRCMYNIDKGETRMAQQIGEGAYHFDLPTDGIEDGFHLLTYWLQGAKSSTSVRTAMFVKRAGAEGLISRYEYWVNDASDDKTVVELDTPVSPYQLTALLPVHQQAVTPRRPFIFGYLNGLPVLRGENVFHITFYNTDDRSVATQATYTDVRPAEVNDITPLSPGLDQQFLRPSEDGFKWFSLELTEGDEISLRTHTPGSFRLYPPSQNGSSGTQPNEDNVEPVLSADGQDATEKHELEVPETGTYYLAVYDIEPESSSPNTFLLDYEYVSNEPVWVMVETEGEGMVLVNTEEVHGFREFQMERSSDVHFIFIPEDGFHLEKVILNDETDITDQVVNSRLTLAADESFFLHAIFVENVEEQVMLTLMTIGEGMVYVEGMEVMPNSVDSTLVGVEHELWMEMMPAEGYKWSRVVINQDDIIENTGEHFLMLDPITEPTFILVEFVPEASDTIVAEMVNIAVTVEGMGSVRINGTEIDEEGSVQVARGSDVVVEFLPVRITDPKNILGKALLNGQSIIDEVKYDVFVIHNAESDMTLNALFMEDIETFVYQGVKYGVTDLLNNEVKVVMYDYAGHVKALEQVPYRGLTWDVTGVARYSFFDCPELVTIDLPATAVNAEQNIVNRCPQLAAITWNAPIQLTSAMQRQKNPNMLYYVKERAYAPDANANIVVDGYSQKILLTDTRGKGDFYCPTPFTAATITYSHEYAQATKRYESRGWETIALPFDVELISHATKGEIYPFYGLSEADIDGGKRPFWLCEYDATGTFIEAEGIKANTPYIIAMPNDPIYEPYYNIPGIVTFSATNATVQASSDMHPAIAGSRTFVPAYQFDPVGANAWVVNVGEKYYNHEPGSLFVRYWFDVVPFTAYIVDSASGAKEFFGINEKLSDGIRELPVRTNASSAGDTYDLSGRKVSESQLRRGIYIRDGRKVLVK